MLPLLAVPLRGSIVLSVLRVNGAVLGALRGPGLPGWREKLCRGLLNICWRTSRLGWAVLGLPPGWPAVRVAERPAAGRAGRSLDDGMDWIDLIDGID